MAIVDLDTKLLTVTINPDGFSDDLFTEDNLINAAINSGLTPFAFINLDGRGPSPVILRSENKQYSISSTQATTKFVNPFKKSTEATQSKVTTNALRIISKQSLPAITNLVFEYSQENLIFKAIDASLSLANNLISTIRFSYFSQNVVTIGAYLKSYSNQAKQGSANIRVVNITLETPEEPETSEGLKFDFLTKTGT